MIDNIKILKSEILSDNWFTFLKDIYMEEHLRT